MEKIDVNILIDKYKNMHFTTKNDSVRFLKREIHINSYLPMVVKYKLADDLVTTAYKINTNGIDSIKVDNAKLYYLEKMMEITYYTNININNDISNYDKLCESGITEILFESILSSKELEEFEKMISFKTKDFIQNNFNYMNVVGVFADMINQSLSSVVNDLSDDKIKKIKGELNE